MPLAKITENMPIVIFVTAYDEFAVRSVEDFALVYLLKPIDENPLEKAVLRAKRQLTEVAGAFEQRLEWLLERFKPRTEYLKRIGIKSPGQTYILTVDEIDWIGAADNYV